MSATVPLQIDLVPELDSSGKQLLALLLEAHQRAARDNNNLSKGVAGAVYLGSKSITQAMAAAMLSTGETHGPITQAREVFENWGPANIIHALNNGKKIPGFGNSFFKGRIDPAWSAVDGELFANYPGAWTHIDDLTNWLEAHKGKRICPNAAMYTAVACTILQVPHGLEPVLFFIARMPVWAQVIANENKLS